MKTSRYLRMLVAGWLSALILLASEHHGQVTFGGLPVPGVDGNGDQRTKRKLQPSRMGWGCIRFRIWRTAPGACK